MAADLHLHTTASDGFFPPETVVAMAHAAHLTAISITDHDSIDGLERGIQEGEKLGIQVIPGIELSTLWQEKEIHILGYFIHYRDRNLQQTLSQLIESRIKRAERTVEKLQQMGVQISLERVQKLAQTPYIGRPHIARALKEKGYIQRLAEAFTPDFIGRGGKAYVERYKIHPQRAIELIKGIGGIAILAHPALIEKGQTFKGEGLETLLGFGLDGIEVFYSGHQKEEEDYYHQLALAKGLLITGGSDFHHLDSGSPGLGPYLSQKYLNILFERSGQS